MRILVINCGSSSLKYQLFDMRAGTVLAAGMVERIGEAEGRFRWQWLSAEGTQAQRDTPADCADHRAALRRVEAALADSGAMRVDAIGHRVVHGGEAFQAPARIDAEVVEAIRRLIPLAPLHNPANLVGIELCLEHFPGVPQVAVFDTAFHQSMPAHAYRYALPTPFYRDLHVRRYGFHGSSHAYVSRRAADLLGRPLAELRLITLHLGNGASAAAIAGGRCIDTSMGMTPLEGLVMGTRCGDIDPALVFYLGRATGMSPEAVEAALNRDSGLKGLCGDNDMRAVLARAAHADPDAELAFALYCYRIRKYVGAYMAALGGLDALVFTAGIGENAPAVRTGVCAGLEGLGLRLDARRNVEPVGAANDLSAPDSAVRILVVRTDEEREIAEQTQAVVNVGA